MLHGGPGLFPSTVAEHVSMTLIWNHWTEFLPNDLYATMLLATFHQKETYHSQSLRTIRPTNPNQTHLFKELVLSVLMQCQVITPTFFTVFKNSILPPIIFTWWSFNKRAWEVLRKGCQQGFFQLIHLPNKESWKVITSFFLKKGYVGYEAPTTTFLANPANL